MEKNKIKDILKKYVEYGEKDYFEAITVEKVYRQLGIDKKVAEEIADSYEYKQMKAIIDKFTEEREFGFGSFTKFYEWYDAQEPKCHYCGTTESNLKKLFKEKDDESEKEKKPLYSKKRSFTATLQVDRKNSDEGYNEKNCVLACAFCNNAKSDMVRYKDLEFFKEHFKEFVQKFYTHLDSTIKYLD